MRMRSAAFRLTAAATVLLATAACAERGDASGEYPNESIEFVTAGDPGGGLDIFAREIKQALATQDVPGVSMTVANLGGGGGNAAMAIGRQRAGTDSTIIANSNRVYLNPIMGITDLTIGKDFVPIAQLMTEYVVLAVRADSPYQEAQDVIDALKADPRSVSMGVGTVPSDDQLHLLRLGKEVGVDPGQMKVVAFSAGGDLMTQLLGGQVDVVSTGLSEALPQYEAGDVRILAISAPERLDGSAAEIPTWKELGIDLVVDHWRGIFGPADMPAEAVSYWEDALEEMTKSAEWKKILDRNQWSPLYRDSKEFSETLDQEQADAEQLLRDVGMVQ